MTVLLLGIIAAAGLCAYWYRYDHQVGNFSQRRSLYVYPGMDVDAVRDSIVAAGALDGRSVERAFFVEKVDTVRPGHYVLDPSTTSIQAARMVRHGWQVPVRLSLSGAIRSRGVLARKVGAQMLVDSAALAAAFNDPAVLARYGVDTVSFFTLVIPDTYELYWTASVGEILDRFARERDAFWTEERLGKARRQGLTPLEVVTLASIVDGETRHVPEQPKIAGVYLNRLRTGMKLQADPTVAYCYGYTLNRILRKHLSVDSPYNTYRCPGLPPGPISCPPKSCIEAVLDPDPHGYLYFCADPSFNGSHRFASTYAEHLANARAFQRALTARLKERAAATAG